MKKGDFYNQIEDLDPKLKNIKSRSWKKIVAETGYGPKKLQRNINIKRWIIVAPVVIIICAIIPIFAVLLKPSPVDFSDRFCTQDDYKLVLSDENLFELAQVDDKLLCFSWVDSESTTNFFVDVNDSNIKFGINELIYNPEMDMEIKINIAYPHYQLDFIENNKEELLYLHTLDNIEIRWLYTKTFAYVYFKYNDYTYFLEFDENYGEQTIIEIVTELINSKN